MRRTILESKYTTHGMDHYMYNFWIKMSCGHEQLWYSNSRNTPPKTAICLKCIKEAREAQTGGTGDAPRLEEK